MFSEVLAAGGKETRDSRKLARGRTTGLVGDSIWEGKSIRVNTSVSAQLQTRPRVQMPATVRK